MIFLLGLFVAATLSIFLEGGLLVSDRNFGLNAAMAQHDDLDFAQPRPLSADDLRAAQVAWVYFERNTQPETGMVNSTMDYPSTTLWDQGGYILALVAAHQMGIVDQAEFDDRTTRVLASLGRLELLETGLPNKVYHTQTLAMVNYQNEPVPGGIGWSALDICRMLMALRILEHRAPQYGPTVREIVGSWEIERVAFAGELIGGARNDDGIEPLQEGRLGYEQYAARAAALWGLDASMAMVAGRNIEWQQISGVDVPTDRRTHQSFGAITPILSEPWLLEAFEMGLNAESAALAVAVFDAQIARISETNQITFVTEDHLDQEPYFVYSSVFANGEAWSVIDEHGEAWPDLRTLSTKASFGWDVLFRRRETAIARELLAETADPQQGWAAGIYERDGEQNRVYSLNTNAVILEALHFGSRGPLWALQ